MKARGVKFNNYVDFSKYSSQEGLDVSEATFVGFTNFHYYSSSKGLKASGAMFNNYTTFYKYNSSEGLDVSNATFNGNVNFGYYSSPESINASGATFKGQIEGGIDKIRYSALADPTDTMDLPTLLKWGDNNQREIRVPAERFPNVNLEEFGFIKQNEEYVRQPITRYSTWGDITTSMTERIDEIEEGEENQIKYITDNDSTLSSDTTERTYSPEEVEAIEKKLFDDVKELSDLFFDKEPPSLTRYSVLERTNGAQGFKLLKKTYGEETAKNIRDLIPASKIYAKAFINLVDKLLIDKKQSKNLLDSRANLLKINEVFEELVNGKKPNEVVIENPFELVKKVGYTLTEAKSVEDMLVFKKDYDKGYTICTFRDGTGAARLQRSYILWLRKDYASDILPYNLLTQEYLKYKSKDAEAWRVYLKSKGAYDKKTDTYIIPKKPSIHDPYAISSISVQFPRDNSDLGRKMVNRYNHAIDTVDGTADAAFDNNLDNVVQNLKNSLRAYLGLELDKTELSYDPKVIEVGDKLFVSNREINETYISETSYLKRNKGVIFVDESSQLLSSDGILFDFKNKTIKDVTDSDAGPNEEYISITKEGNTVKAVTKEGVEYEFVFEDKDIVYVKTNAKNIGNKFLYNNTTIRSIDVSSAETIGNDFLYSHQNLEFIDVSKANTIGNNFLYNNTNLQYVDASSAKTIGDNFLFNNIYLSLIELKSVKTIGEDFLYRNKYLNYINVRSAKKIGPRFLYSNKELESIILRSAEDIGDYFLLNNEKLKYINVRSAKRIRQKFLYNNKKLKSINLRSAKVIDAYFLHNNENLNYINVSSVENIGFCFLSNNKKLKSIDVSSAKTIGDYFLGDNIILESIDVGSAETIGNEFLYNNKNLKYIDVRSAKKIGYKFLYNNENLEVIYIGPAENIGESIDVSPVESIDYGFLAHNTKLKFIDLSSVKFIDKYEFLSEHPHREQIIRDKKYSEIKEGDTDYNTRYSASSMNETPHQFPKEVLIRESNGGLKYLIGDSNNFPSIPEGATVLKKYPYGRFRLDRIKSNDVIRFSAGTHNPLDITQTEIQYVMDIYEDLLRQDGFEDRDVIMAKLNELKDKVIYKISPNTYMVDYNNDVRIIAAGMSDPLDAMTLIAHLAVNNIINEAQKGGKRANLKQKKILETYNNITGENKSVIDVDVKRFFADAFLSFAKYAVDGKVSRSDEASALFKELFDNMSQEVLAIVTQSLEDSLFERAAYKVKKPLLDVFNQLFGRDTKRKLSVADADFNRDDIDNAERRVSRRAMTIASQLKMEGDMGADDLIEALTDDIADYKVVRSETLLKLAERFASGILLKKDIQNTINDLVSSIEAKISGAFKPLMEYSSKKEEIDKLRAEGKEKEAIALEEKANKDLKKILKNVYWEVLAIEILLYRLQGQDLKLTAELMKRYSAVLTNLGMVTGTLAILGPGYELTVAANIIKTNNSVGEQEIGTGIKKKTLLNKILNSVKAKISNKWALPDDIMNAGKTGESITKDIAQELAKKSAAKDDDEVILSANSTSFSAEEIRIAKYAYYMAMADKNVNAENLYNSQKEKNFANYNDIVSSEEFQKIIATEVSDSILEKLSDALTSTKPKNKPKGKSDPYKTALNAILGALRRQGKTEIAAKKTLPEMIRQKEITIEVLTLALENIMVDPSLTPAQRAQARVDAEDVLLTLAESLNKLTDKYYFETNEALIDQYFSKAKIRRQARESAQAMRIAIKDIADDILAGQLKTSVLVALIERAGIEEGQAPIIEKMIRDYVDEIIASEIELAYRNELFNSLDIQLSNRYVIQEVQNKKLITGGAKTVYKIVDTRSGKIVGTFDTMAEANAKLNTLNLEVLPKEKRILAEIDNLKNIIASLNAQFASSTKSQEKNKIRKEIEKAEKRLKALYSRLSTKNQKVNLLLDATGKVPSKKQIIDAIMFKGGLSEEALQNVSQMLGYSETMSMDDLDVLKSYVAAYRNARSENDKIRILNEMRQNVKKPGSKDGFWSRSTFLRGLADTVSFMTAFGYASMLSSPQTAGVALSGGFIAWHVYMLGNFISSIAKDMKNALTLNFGMENMRGALREYGYFWREFLPQGDIFKISTLRDIFFSERPMAEMSISPEMEGDLNIFRPVRISMLQRYKSMKNRLDNKTNPVEKALGNAALKFFYAIAVVSEILANALPAFDYAIGAGIIRSNIERSIWDKAIQRKKESGESTKLAEIAREISEELADNNALDRLVLEDALYAGIPSIEVLEESIKNAKTEAEKRRLKKELKYVKEWYNARRAERWLDNFTDRESLTQAIILKNRFTFTGRGTGIFGKIGDWTAGIVSRAVSEIEEGKADFATVASALFGAVVVTPIIPFARVAGRSIQIALESIPLIGNIDLSKPKEGVSLLNKEEKIKLLNDDPIINMIKNPSNMIENISRTHVSVWDPKIKQWTWLQLTPTVVNSFGIGNAIMAGGIAYLLFKALFEWDEDKEEYTISNDWVITEGTYRPGFETWSLYKRNTDKGLPTYTKVFNFSDVPQLGVIFAAVASLVSKYKDDTSKKRAEKLDIEEVMIALLQGVVSYSAEGGAASISDFTNIFTKLIAPEPGRDALTQLPTIPKDIISNVATFYIPYGGLGRWLNKYIKYYTDQGSMPQTFQKTEQAISGHTKEAFEKNIVNNAILKPFYEWLNPDKDTGYALTSVGNPSQPNYVTSNIEQAISILLGMEDNAQKKAYYNMPFPKAMLLDIVINPYYSSFRDIKWKEKAKEGNSVLPPTAPAEIQRDVINIARIMKGSLIQKEGNYEIFVKNLQADGLNKRHEKIMAFSNAVNSHVLAAELFLIIDEEKHNLGITKWDINDFIKKPSKDDTKLSFTPRMNDIVTADNTTFEEVLEPFLKTENQKKLWAYLAGKKMLNLDAMIKALRGYNVYIEHDRVLNRLVPVKDTSENVSDIDVDMLIEEGELYGN